MVTMPSRKAGPAIHKPIHRVWGKGKCKKKAPVAKKIGDAGAADTLAKAGAAVFRQRSRCRALGASRSEARLLILLVSPAGIEPATP